MQRGDHRRVMKYFTWQEIVTIPGWGHLDNREHLRGDWKKENKMVLWMLLESSFQALDSRGKKHELLTKNTTGGWRGKSVQQQELNFQSWMGEDKWDKKQLLDTRKQRQLMYSWIKKRVPSYWCTAKGCKAKLKGYETYLSYSVLERALVR